MLTRVQTTRTNFSDGSFQQFRGEKLSHVVAVCSTSRQLLSAASWVLHLIGCRNVFEYSEVNDVTARSIVSEGVQLVFCDVELGENLFDGLGKHGSPLSAVVVLLCPRQLDRPRLSALLKRGASGYITKPVRVQALRGMVVKHCGLPASAENQEEFESENQEAPYEKVGVIGVGAFGEVSSVRRNRDGRYFALKETSLTKLDARSQQRVLNELQLHRSFCFPCIVRTYSSWCSKESACLLMEYVSAGSLSNQVQKCCKSGTAIPDATVLCWFAQILLGLIYLHGKAVLHRDLKLDNVLGPDNAGCLKLSDFGVSTHLEVCADRTGDLANMSYVGTPLIMSPERCDQDTTNMAYGPESDLWSLGVVVYELITLKPPFVSLDQIKLAQPSPLPATRCAPLHPLVGGLLQKHPDDRPCTDDLVRNPIVRESIYKFLESCNLLNDPSVLEIIDVLPNRSSEPGSTRIDVSTADVVSLHQHGKTDEIRMELSISNILARQMLQNDTCGELPNDGNGMPRLHTRTQSLSEQCGGRDAEESISPGKVRSKELRARAKMRGKSTSSNLSLDTLATGITEHEFRALEKADDSVARGRSVEDVRQRGRTENWLLDRSSLKVDKDVLGSGAFGVVNAGELYGTSVALKMPKLASDARSCDEFLANELRVLRHVRHPGVVSFCGACIEQNTGVIVLALERVAGSNLGDFIRHEELSLDPFTRYSLLLDICAALRYLHSNDPSIVHGDLKDSNILVEKWSSGPRPKLLDFGLSRMLTKHVSPLGGTLKWMAPEIILDQSLAPTSNVDVFSFGRLAFLIVTSIPPLANMTGDAIIKTTMARMVPPLQWPSRSSPLSSKCRELVEPCLELNRLRRPSMAEVEGTMKSWGPPGGTDRNNIRLERMLGKTCGDALDWLSGMAQLSPLLQDSLDVDTGSRTLGGRISRLSIRGSAKKEDRLESFFSEVMALANAHKRLIDMSRAELLPDALACVGCFGLVVPAYLDGVLVSIRIPKQSASKNADVKSELSQSEMQVSFQVRHPNIAMFYGIGFTPLSNGLSPIMEWVEGLPLPNYVRESCEAQDPSTQQRLLLETCSALWYLHERKPAIVHGHLKGTGIMVEAREGHPRAKLLDWGWPRHLSGEACRWLAPVQKKDAPDWLHRARRNLLIWTAPELIDKKRPKLLTSADVFSLGRVCYLLVTGRDPLSQCDMTSLELAAKKATSLPLDWSDDLQLIPRCRLIAERCFNRNETVRPAVSAIYNDIKAWPLPTVRSQFDRLVDKGANETPGERGNVRRQKTPPTEAEQRRLLGRTTSSGKTKSSLFERLPSIEEQDDVSFVSSTLRDGNFFECHDVEDPMPFQPWLLPKALTA